MTSCVKCGTEVDSGWKLCPNCGTAIGTYSGGSPTGGIIDSVVKADSIHVGDQVVHEAPDPSRKRQATHTGINCPICHQIVVGADHFACPKCKRTHIHIRHQDQDTYLCRECNAALKRARGTIETGDSFGTGRYVVKEHLGQGGMGQVFLVSDKEWGKDFAFKFLPEALSSDKSAVASLKKEAGLMAQLTHENLARIFDMGSDGSRHYIKMEYIDGKTLAEILEESRDGKLSVDETLGFLKQIVNGLQYLHDKNVVHRDLKPGNIMVIRDGSVKILDFGIAQTIKDTMTRVTNMPSTGTLIYMSPEQLQGRKLSPRSDIYSLGIIIYELLNGKPPFHTGPIFEQHLNVDPEPIAGLEDYLNDCILKSLRKNAGQRQGSCSELFEELMHGIPEEAKPGTGALKKQQTKGTPELPKEPESPEEQQAKAVPEPPREPEEHISQASHMIANAKAVTEAEDIDKASVLFGRAKQLDPELSEADDLLAKIPNTMKSRNMLRVFLVSVIAVVVVIFGVYLVQSYKNHGSTNVLSTTVEKVGSQEGGEVKINQPTKTVGKELLYGETVKRAFEDLVYETPDTAFIWNLQGDTIAVAGFQDHSPRRVIAISLSQTGRSIIFNVPDEHTGLKAAALVDISGDTFIFYYTYTWGRYSEIGMASIRSILNSGRYATKNGGSYPTADGWKGLSRDEPVRGSLKDTEIVRFLGKMVDSLEAM